MPKCSLGNCKNITSRTLKSDGISYFRFPRDPIRCKEWISVVRRSRRGIFFKPNKSNVVCSEHFSEKDMYITEKGRVRLLKKAVPLVPTFIRYSLYSFPSDPLTCAEWISIVAKEREEEFYKPAKTSVICSDHFDKLEISGNTNRRRLIKTAVPKLQTDTQANGDVTQASCATSTITSQNVEEYKPPIASLNISSVFNTPEETLLEMELEKCRKRLKGKNIIISNLRKKNSRLIKRNAVLKSALKILRKKIKLDSNLYQEPTQYVFVCEQND